MHARYTLMHVLRNVEGKRQDICLSTIGVVEVIDSSLSFRDRTIWVNFEFLLRETRVKLTAPPRSDRFVVGVLQLAPCHGAWHA